MSTANVRVSDVRDLLMKVLPIIVAALELVCTGCQTSRALKETIPASESVGLKNQHTERIGDIVRQTMRKEGIPGVSIAVIDQGQVVWAQGFGWRDVKGRLPVNTDTQFQAGSISKAVTALGVLQLEASSKLCLDRDVNTYLTGWHLDSKFTNAITLRELLCHRAGMVPHAVIGCTDHERVPTVVEVLNRHQPILGWLTANQIGTFEVAYPPGAGYVYSSGGYCVVQKVVEDVTGEAFELTMDKFVLRPARMSRSSFQQPPQDTNNIACGYGWTKTLLGGGRWRVYPEKAAAGLWTTPLDLARFAVAVQRAAAGETIAGITPALVQEYLTPQFDGCQGIGIRLDGSGEDRAFYHAGETEGYFARIAAGVSKGRGYVIMTNANKDRFDPIVKAIAREFAWIQNP